MSAALDQAKQNFRDAEAALAAECLREAKTEVRRLFPNAASFDVEGEYDDDFDKRGHLLFVHDADGNVIADRDRDYGEGDPYDELWDSVEMEMVDWFVTLAWDEYQNKTTIRIDEVTP